MCAGANYLRQSPEFRIPLAGAVGPAGCRTFGPTAPRRVQGLERRFRRWSERSLPPRRMARRANTNATSTTTDGNKPSTIFIRLLRLGHRLIAGRPGSSGPVQWLDEG